MEQNKLVIILPCEPALPSPADEALFSEIEDKGPLIQSYAYYAPVPKSYLNDNSSYHLLACMHEMNPHISSEDFISKTKKDFIEGLDSETIFMKSILFTERKHITSILAEFRSNHLGRSIYSFIPESTHYPGIGVSKKRIVFSKFENRSQLLIKVTTAKF